MEQIEQVKLLKEPVLCYVEDTFAYFTNCPLEHQWGDDWNDAPYEYNAGTPYDWSPYQLEKYGVPHYEISIMGFMGDFIMPKADYLNSPYSVETINRGDVAWLRPKLEGAAPIFAGCALSDFKRLILLAGGTYFYESRSLR